MADECTCPYCDHTGEPCDGCWDWHKQLKEMFGEEV